MNDKKKIVLTGGGTTGHVSVNLALITVLKKENWEIHYIGSKDGIEKELISAIDDVEYHEISTGRLRRFLTIKNFFDLFRVLFGILQSIFKLAKIKPNIVFSKGGFVSVPVIIGSWVNRIPSITHESDLTPGLANKLIQPFVSKIFTTFPETTKYIKSGKGEFLGPVIRSDLIGGNKDLAREKLDIVNNKPIILVMGGSLGAKYINDIIRKNLDYLLEYYNIIHACGKNGIDKSIKKQGYYQYDYIKEDLNHILDLSDIVISRSGANAIFEFLYYKIPMLLIPLSSEKSRGDQIQNANSFEKQGFAIVMEQDKIINEDFLNNIKELDINREKYIENMKKFKFENTTQIILDNIKRFSK